MAATPNDQSAGAIQGYLDVASQMVEENFGRGSTGEHPLLVTDVTYALAQDFHTTAIVVMFGQLIDKLDEVVRALGSLKTAAAN